MPSRFQAAFAASPVAMILVDRAGCIVEANALAAHMFGYSLEELQGQVIEELVPLRDRVQHALMRDAFFDRMESRLMGSGRELFARRRDGSEFPVEIGLNFIPTGDGPPLVMTVIIDISKRLQAQAALRESEEQFRSVFQLASVGMAQLDAATGRFSDVNDRYCQLTGYGRSELQEMTPAELTHPADRDADRALIERFFRGEIPEYFNEKRYVRKSGEIVWVQINASLIRNARGEPVRTVAIVHDITARKLAEIALQASQERLQQAVQVGKVGVFDHDHLTDEIHFSAEMRQLGDWDPGEKVTLQGCLDRIPAEDRAAIAAAIEQAHDVSGTGIYDVEHRILWRDGTVHWIRVKARTFFEESGGARRALRTIGAGMDVTTEKEWRSWLQAINAELERKVQERTAELQAEREAALSAAQAAIQARQQAEQMAQALALSNAELEQFAYVASHDLQEPLRKVQAFGNLLSQYRDQLGPEGLDYLARMERAAQRMQTLINDLLTLSRVVRRGQPFEPVDLNTVVAEVLGDLETRLRQSGGQVDVGPLPVLAADPTQMRQLFQNLIGNALKYCRPEQPPRVVVRAHALPACSAGTDSTAPLQEGWEIRVQDNGIGFEQKYAERIFQPFQRLHGRNEYEGTGMGLAICRRIVERHKGRIQAQGQPGLGATFVVTLPATHPGGGTQP